MQAFHSPDHARHANRHYLVRGRVTQSAEQPERADRLLAALHAGGHAVAAPDPVRMEMVRQIHTPQYLDFLENGPAEWAKLPNASEEIIPAVYTSRNMGGYPTGIVGRAGWHSTDQSAPVNGGTWTAALAAASVALSATRAVLEGAPVAYALCRPPGHHAYADQCGGFCYLNNVAIAAQAARERHERVAILDVDVHAGNGTTGIFDARGDVFVASLHGDPANYYPWFGGYAAETGSGDGAGKTLNIPLAHGTGDEGYMPHLDHALDAIRAHKPGLILVSLGLDAHEHDPLGVLKITRDGFAEIARRVARLGLPTVLVQEGGYLTDDLGPNLGAFLAGFEGARG